MIAEEHPYQLGYLMLPGDHHHLQVRHVRRQRLRVNSSRLVGLSPRGVKVLHFVEGKPEVLLNFDASICHMMSDRASKKGPINTGILDSSTWYETQSTFAVRRAAPLVQRGSRKQVHPGLYLSKIAALERLDE